MYQFSLVSGNGRPKFGLLLAVCQYSCESMQCSPLCIFFRRIEWVLSKVLLIISSFRPVSDNFILTCLCLFDTIIKSFESRDSLLSDH